MKPKDGDDQAVTEFWLESIGFDFDRSAEGHFGHISIHECGLNALRYIDDFEYWDWRIDGKWQIPTPATRDDVRNLCRLLGAKLKEPQE